MKHINDIATAPNLPVLRERFARNVATGTEDECWEWLGTRDPAGYGQVQMRGVLTKAHRIAWVLGNGAIPDSGRKRSLSVCHTCDNRGCVNPKHLFLGTDADNAADMVRKKRQRHGDTHQRTKITTAQKLAIRSDTRPVRVIAEEYGVSKATVYITQRKGPKLQRQKLPRRIGHKTARKTKYSDEVIVAVRQHPGTLHEVSALYGMSTTSAHSIRTGRIGAHIPLDPNRAVCKRGRPPGPNHQPKASIGVLGQTRETVRAVLANAIKHPEGWLISDIDRNRLEQAALKSTAEQP